MSDQNFLKKSPKVCSAISSFKWFENAIKILSSNIWHFITFALLTVLIIQVTVRVSPIIGIFASTFFSLLFTASLAKQIKRNLDGKQLKLADFFDFKHMNANQIITSGFIYLGGVIIVVFTAFIPINDFFTFTPEQFETYLNLSAQEQQAFIEKYFIENPDSAFPLLISMLIILLGLTTLQAASVFAPILLSQHTNLNAFQAMKTSLIGVFKNILSMLTYGIILFPILILASLLLEFGIAIFLLIFNASAFFAYQEIFVNINDDANPNANNTSKPYEYTSSEDLDSRDF